MSKYPYYYHSGCNDAHNKGVEKQKSLINKSTTEKSGDSWRNSKHNHF